MNLLMKSQVTLRPVGNNELINGESRDIKTVIKVYLNHNDNNLNGTPMPIYDW